jgi:hypothetical protein
VRTLKIFDRIYFYGPELDDRTSCLRKCSLGVPRIKDTQFLVTTNKIYTPYSRVLLEKLTGFQLVKKFAVFYETRKFINAFTSARHLSLSLASLIQSTPAHPTSRRPTLILFFHLCLGLPVASFHQVSPPKLSIRLSSPPYALNAPPIPFLQNLHTHTHTHTQTHTHTHTKSNCYTKRCFMHQHVIQDQIRCTNL